MKEVTNIQSRTNKGFKTLTALSATNPDEVAFFEYAEDGARTHRTSLKPSRLLNMQDKITPVNFDVQNDRIVGKSIIDTFEAAYHATHAVHNYILNNYRNPAGHDEEASSLLVEILRYFGIKNANIVTGAFIIDIT